MAAIPSNQSIHSSAVIGPEVDLSQADDLIIGPNCSLEGLIRIGPGNVFMGHNYLKGPLTIGEGNRIYPFVCLGFEPQDFKFDASKPCAGLRIGNRNVFRENVTIHRSTSATVPTTIGDENFFMVGTHAGHDVVVGNRCVLANGAMLGGHAHLGDQVNIGGNAGIGQHTHVGRLAFIGGNGGGSGHVAPFMMSRRLQSVGGINLIGLRRSGMSREEVDHVKWAFRVIYLMHNTRPAAVEMLAQRAPTSPAIREIHDFIIRVKGPLCRLEEGKESRAMIEQEFSAASSS